MSSLVASAPLVQTWWSIPSWSSAPAASPRSDRQAVVQHGCPRATACLMLCTTGIEIRMLQSGGRCITCCRPQLAACSRSAGPAQHLAASPLHISAAPWSLLGARTAYLWPLLCALDAVPLARRRSGFFCSAMQVPSSVHYPWEFVKLFKTSCCRCFLSWCVRVRCSSTRSGFWAAVTHSA